MIAGALLAALALAGCDDATLKALAGAATEAAGSSTATTGAVGAKKYKLTATFLAPQDQVAVITAGGGNVITAGGGNVITAGGGNAQGPGDAGSFAVLARSDEKGLPQAKVKAAALEGAGSATGQTDGTGKVTLELPAGGYQLSASFSTKDGKSVTISGLAWVKDGDASYTVDLASNMVASKLLMAGAKKVTGDQFKKAVAALEDDMSSIAKTPTPASQDEAAAEFDKDAGAETKKLVDAIVKGK
jgi:hypothetical protein